MDLPELRYSYVDGRKASEFIIHDGMECRYVLHPNGFGAWYTRGGLALTQGFSTSHGKEEDRQGSQGDGRVQAGDTPERQAGTRQGSKGKKPQAGDSHCAI